MLKCGVFLLTTVPTWVCTSPFKLLKEKGENRAVPKGSQSKTIFSFYHPEIDICINVKK